MNSDSCNYLPKSKFLGKLSSLVAACCMLGACAAAVVAPVAGEVAGPAIDKGGDVMKAGKAQTHQPVPIDDMTAITRRAAGELDLKQVGEEKHTDQIKLVYRDQRKQDITVTLVRRTAKATEIHIDVGLLGDSGMGQLMLRQMLNDMPRAAAGEKKAQDATATPVDGTPVQMKDDVHAAGTDENRGN